MIGDVIFFKQTSFISKIITTMTKSEFSHVGLIVAYDETTGRAVVIESDIFIKTRLHSFALDDKRHVVFTTGDKSDEQINRVLKYSYSHLGKKYDYFLIVGLFFSLLFKKKNFRSYFNRKNKLICSELIDVVYFKAGIKRNNLFSLSNVTPQELLEVYDFRIRKGV